MGVGLRFGCAASDSLEGCNGAGESVVDRKSGAWMEAGGVTLAREIVVDLFRGSLASISLRRLCCLLTFRIVLGVAIGARNENVDRNGYTDSWHPESE